MSMTVNVDAWFLYELDTGLIDGWYMSDDPDHRSELLDFWRMARPSQTHIIAFRTFEAGEVDMYIDSDRCLETHHKRCIIEAQGAVKH